MSAILKKQSLAARVAVVAFVAFGVAGCDDAEDSTDVRVELYTVENQDHLLQADSPAQAMELVLINEDDPEGTQKNVEFDVRRGEGRLPSLPFGQGYRLYVRGFAADGDRPLFYGSSARFDVARGDRVPVPVQIGATECVGLNRSSVTNRVPEGADDLVTGRVGGSSIELPDGRVLIFGGARITGDGSMAAILREIEIYDPSRGQFIALEAQLGEPRAFHSATLLPGGGILVVGGVTAIAEGAMVYAQTAEAIIPTLTGVEVRSLSADPSVVQRAWHTATLLTDSTVLIAGGEGPSGPLSTAWRFFPGSGFDPFEQARFVRQIDLREPRSRHAAAPLSWNAELAVMIMTGGRAGDAIIGPTEVFTINPEQTGCTGDARASREVGCFVRLGGGRLAEPRWGHSMVSLARTGREVVILGGFTDAEATAGATRIEVLQADMTFLEAERAGSMTVGRGEATVTRLPGREDRLLLLGGRRGSTPLREGTVLVPRRDAEGRLARFDESTLSRECTLSEPRFGHQTVLLRQGSVLITGGATTGRENALVASRRGELFFPRVDDLADVYPLRR